MKTITSYIKSHQDQFESELMELLRIPSVSADDSHKGDMLAAASWVHGKFDRMGLASEIIRTDRHPIVYAESPPVEGAPVILVYGHYDVQPPDPLEKWETPPFEPNIRDGSIYARGATDDKGQMLTHLFSTEAWLKEKERLPVQLKFLIEGEEEVGSESLSKFLPENRKKLACDCVVVSDTSMFAPGQPSLTYGLRGIISYELTIRGPSHDLHSGTFGGAVLNPAMALSRMLTSLVDENGKIQIPSFYEDVVPITPREHSQFAMLPFDEKAYFKRIGVAGGFGESGFTTLERRWGRPSLDINGLTSGYQGTGSKTIIPSHASAKFSVRLVPEQDPAKVSAAVREMLEAACPPQVEMELEIQAASPGMVVSLESPYVQAASRSLEKVFGRPPVFTREGGSIPVIAELAQQLKAEVLIIGWGQDDDNLHAPNEKFSLKNFRQGITTSARLWQQLSKCGK
jgi:succinyl-diaminopimelate desuccinylase